MSPEGIALVVTLFWGLTAIWLAYRTARGRRGQHPLESFTERSNGLWLCGTCLSLNRRDVNLCYNCRTGKGFSGRQTPGELPVSRGVPVMAEGIAGRQTPGELPVSRGVPVMAEGIAGRQTPGELPVSRGVPVMAEGIAGGQTPGELLVSRGVPVMAEGSAGSSVEDAGTTVAPATPRNAFPAPEILVRAPEHRLSAAVLGAPTSVPVCPFLGFRDDPSTRYDFPDPANLCHAPSGRASTSLASPRRFVTGSAGHRRPQPIAAQHQKSRCLTAAHQQCARYPAVEVVAANR
jgi:hypothetical protein